MDKPIFGPLTKRKITPEVQHIQDTLLSANHKLGGHEIFQLSTVCDLYGHEGDVFCPRNINTNKGELYVGSCKMAIDHNAKFK